MRDSNLSRNPHFEAILRIRLSLFTNPDETLKKRAIFMYSNSTYGLMVMPDSNVVEKDTGNATGGGNTINDNTIGTDLDINYAFHKLFPDWSSLDLRNNVMVAIVGDDARVSPSASVAQLVTPQDIAKVLYEDLGVIINWELGRWGSLFECPWLSMKTGYYGAETADQVTPWLVPVPEEPTKLIASCYYGRENFTPLDTLRRIVNFRMLSYTEPKLFEFFDKWTRLLIKENMEVWCAEKEWCDLVHSLMPVESLQHLYLGWESGSTPVAPGLEFDDCMDQDFGPWLSSLRPTVVPLVNAEQGVHLTNKTVKKAGKPSTVKSFLLTLLCFLCLFGLTISCDLRYPLAQNVTYVREPVKFSNWVMGVGEAPSGGRLPGRFSPVPLNLEMPPKKQKQPLTPAQKEKRKVKRKAARQRREAKRRAAMAGKPLTGSGDYQRKPDRRLTSKLRGRGDFFGDLWDGAKNLANGTIKAAGWISDNAGWLGGLLGAGDYRVNQQPRHNSLFRGSMVPQISNSRIPTIIHHREYLGEITSYSGLGGTAIQTQSFNVNPALPSSAPWLNAIAGKHAEYILLGGALEYVTEQTAISTDSVGTVVLSPRYDVTLPAPTSSGEVLNTEGKVDGRPMDNLLMGIECDPALRPVEVLQCRTGALPANASLQLFDHCIVDITNWGQADSTKTIGHLYLAYEIALLNPVDLDANAGEVLTDHFQLSTVTTANNLGTTAAAVSTSTLGGTVTAGATQKYTFPSFVNGGQYLVAVYWASSATATTSSYTFTGTNCTKDTIFSSSSAFDAATQVQTPNSGLGSCTGQGFMCVVNISNTPASFVLSGGTFSGTTFGDLVVTPWSGNVVSLHQSRTRWRRHWAALDEEERVRSEQTELIAERTTRRILKELLGICSSSKLDVSDDEKDFDKISPRSLKDAAVKLLGSTDLSSLIKSSIPSPRKPQLVQAAAPKGAPRNG